MQRIKDKRLSQAEAGELLKVSLRQVKRPYRVYKADEAKGLVSDRRGRPSNHRLGQEVVKQATDLIYERYRDFGPTLAHVKLVEVQGLKLSD